MSNSSEFDFGTGHCNIVHHVLVNHECLSAQWHCAAAIFESSPGVCPCCSKGTFYLNILESWRRFSSLKY